MTSQQVRRLVPLAILVSAGLIAGAVGTRSAPAPTTATASCIATTNRSVARAWNQSLLNAIRLDVPSPTVHSRNLYHVSAAMWDAWAAYDDDAAAVFVDEHIRVDEAELDAARNEAISFAAYRVLVARYLHSPRAEESVTGFDALITDLCYDLSFTETDGTAPAAVGNRIAAQILAATVDDGSNEAQRYADTTYRPVNDPLVVAESGADMTDPNRWQALEIQGMVAQNGEPLDETVQVFIGSQWGGVTPFALDPGIGPGPPPLLGDPGTDDLFKAGVLEVLRHGATLDPTSGIVVDIGPAATGDAVPDTYQATGRPRNPVTGEPYAPNEVLLGDFSRVVAEFWADGPTSETPPGHWNVVANEVTDHIEVQRIGGQGPTVPALEWDVKLYLALNGAMHDSAVAAWGAKRTYDYARPISMIRYMGGLGQSSEPDGPAFDPHGLPLEPGLVEVITAASSAPGERHQDLADHVGEIAVYSWFGRPVQPATGLSGVGWILAIDWRPYQLRTFVTPAFPGYVSGHSTFSRAAAEVLGEITGSPYFPGGLGEWTVPAGSLEFDYGPETDVVLQWATFVDASDQAGESRLYGGIHPPADDFAGRRLGARIGRAAWALAETYFDPTQTG